MRYFGISICFFLSFLWSCDTETETNEVIKFDGFVDEDVLFAQKNQARFYLYVDQRNENGFDEVQIGQINTLDKYKAEQKLIIIIHGFQENAFEKFPQYTKNAYLRTNYPGNIIMVDWRGRAQPPYGFILNLLIGYYEAGMYLDTFASQVANLIHFLISSGKLRDPSDIHLVGFSMGGQMVGLIGYNILQTTGRCIGRITGLDPAGLDYHLRTDLTKKLDPSDADFVDVIHTGIGTYGYKTSIGHVDFYPNAGGPKQPGCFFPIDLVRDLSGLPGSCAHSRAYDFFIQSIYNGSIISCKGRDYFTDNCDNQIIFGQHTSMHARGDFYLQINPKFD